MKKLQKIIAVLLVFMLVFIVKPIAGSATQDTQEYTVQKGDFLWKIAAEQLGDGYRFMEIFELNKDKISDINLIYPGQKFLIPQINSVLEADMIPGSSASNVGDKVNGFVVKKITDFDLINSDIILLEHEKTGAKVMYMANEDTNRVFEITFRTPALNDTGLTHVLEHSTLEGSEKYPSKGLFMNLKNQTYNTYMNASTYVSMTSYPVASLSEAQLLKYADYYTDSCFNPIVFDNDSIFKEEAWRYVLADADDDLTIAGTVYSEMKGSYSISKASYFNYMKTLFPGSNFANVSGGQPEYIPDLTWKDVCDYHSEYYHPSNSYTVLYGKFEDFDAFLELLDGYFSKYEKEDISIEDDEYVPITESVEQVFTYGFEEGSDTDKGSYIYYGFRLDTDDIDTLNKLDMLSVLISDESSVFQQNMKKELPYASANCSLDLSSSGSAFYFYASGVNEEDTATFKKIVDKSLKTMSKEGFDMEAVDALAASDRLGVLLTGESSEIGIDIITYFMYYWTCTGDELSYIDYTNSIDYFKQYAEDGTFSKLIKKKFLSKDTVTALVTTVPEAGLKEQQEDELAAELAAYKASLSDAEIQALVDATAAYASEEPEDTTEYIRQLTAVTVDSLPEEIRIYDYTDETGADGIRRIDVQANVDGVGRATILFDAKGLTQDQIQYLQLYTDLLGCLDTDRYPVAQLSSKITRYLYNLSLTVSVADINSEEKYHPYLATSFTAMDEDVAAAYDLIYEILYNTKFTNLDQLKGEVTALKTSIKRNTNSNAYIAQIYRLIGARDEAYAYYNELTYFRYYEFLSYVEALLESNPDAVVEALEVIQSYFFNSTNAISGFVGSKDSAANNRAIADKFLAGLNSDPIVPQEYKFAEIPSSEGIIIDSAVQYNALFADLEALGIDVFTGDLAAIASYVEDTYLVPLIREQYGAYDILHGMFKEGMYIVSYRDPNILETYEVYSQLPELVKSLAEVDQETLDGYILSNYSGYALSSGELTGGYSALNNIISGFEQERILEYMRQLKAISPESAAKYVDLYSKMIQNGIISTSGSAAAINANASLFEVIINPFGSADKSQVVLTDVNETDSFYDAVRYVYESGYMNALNDDTFGVAEEGTLGELANVFYMMIGGDYDPEGAIAYLSAYGIVPAGNADDVLTREEVADYTATFLTALGMDYPEALSEVYPLEGLENPKAASTRADIATITYLLDK